MAHILVTGTVLSDRRLPLPGRTVVVGRSLGADVPLPHRSVSRRHALIEEVGTGYAVSDLGSVNGTWVGERRLAPGERAAIALSAPFRVGDVVLRVVPDEAVGPAAAASGTGRPAAARAAAPAPGAKARRPRRFRRPRRAAERWGMMIATLVLLAAAAYFLARILAR